MAWHLELNGLPRIERVLVQIHFFPFQVPFFWWKGTHSPFTEEWSSTSNAFNLVLYPFHGSPDSKVVSRMSTTSPAKTNQSPIGANWSNFRDMLAVKQNCSIKTIIDLPTAKKWSQRPKRWWRLVAFWPIHPRPPGSSYVKISSPCGISSSPWQRWKIRVEKNCWKARRDLSFFWVGKVVEKEKGFFEVFESWGEKMLIN